MRKPKITAIGGGHVGVPAALRLVGSQFGDLVLIDAFANDDRNASLCCALQTGELTGAHPVRQGPVEL